jgi:hypothetical protein
MIMISIMKADTAGGIAAGLARHVYFEGTVISCLSQLMQELLQKILP